MEVEEKNNISFLDVLTIRNRDGSMAHQVSRKPTHTNRYLHANSHHFPSQKLGVINTLITQALRISDKELVEQEIKHLAETFILNGYKDSLFDKMVRRACLSNIKQRKNTQEEKIISLPYIKGLSEKLSRILRKGDIKVAFPSKKYHQENSGFNQISN